ncbi:MAG: queuosine precursor transporter [Bacteroidales bacterium]|nr:queuosine precursor transporter [Bacteroidales bacterium]
MKHSTTYVWLAVIFCVCLVSSNLFVPRTWQVGTLPLQLSGAILIFPISYIVNDCLTEIYGYKAAMRVIVMGFVMSLFVSLMAGLVTKLPAPLYEDNLALSDAFNSLFGLAPRTAVASLLAFFAGSTVNARIMSVMKEKSGEKGFGFRAILSSLGGESVDSLIFFPMVFAGIMPFKGIVSLVFTQVICKTLYELIILPLTAFIVRLIKKKESNVQYE